MSIPVWVSTDAPYCRPDDNVREAIQKMTRWDCESLPVCDRDGKLVGSITMRAVCLHADASGKRMDGMWVREALEAGTPACLADDRAPDVMRRMSEARQWSLPLVDQNQALIGLVRFRALQRCVEGDADVIRIDPEDGCGDTSSLCEVGFGEWRVSRKSMELRSPAGDRRHLTRAELKMLLVMAKHAASVLTRETLMHEVCNREWDPSDRYIDVLVGNLRRKFGERAASARVILTIQGEGYLFALRVKSPSTRAGTPRFQRSRRSEALALFNWTKHHRGFTQDQIPPVTLDEIIRLYEEQDETAAQTFCFKRRVIASICMSCSRLFRVVESQGSPGGLSHGWCSTGCAQLGAASASAE